MLDLFVISLTMSLINRDQLLAFTMGPAAFYFGAAVILTILAVEWLDSRLLWDAHESGNPASPTEARIKTKRRISPFWLLPVIALLIAGWLVWEAIKIAVIPSPSILCLPTVSSQAERRFVIRVLKWAPFRIFA